MHSHTPQLTPAQAGNKLLPELEAPFAALRATARQVAKVATEAGMEVDVDEYVDSFRPGARQLHSSFLGKQSRIPSSSSSAALALHRGGLAARPPPLRAVDRALPAPKPYTTCKRSHTHTLSYTHPQAVSPSLAHMPPPPWDNPPLVQT
jgi:hypothetical protein